MKRETPDLMGVLPSTKRGPGRPRTEKPKNAEQIAADFEARGKKYIETARILRGKK